MKPVIYITRQLPEEIIAPLHEKFNVRMWESASEAVPREILLKEVVEADALWTVLADSIDLEVFDAAMKLKVVSNLAVGFNNIDIETAKKKGVTVTNTPDVLTETTADLAFALILATARRVTEAERELRKGNWKSWSVMDYTGMDVGGATLGIIGMGRIGEAAARRAKGFNMRVIYQNRTRKPESEEKHGFEYATLDTLLQESDIVLIFAPLTTETKNMIGEKELAKMKKTGILVNVARGGIVNEVALYNALKDGTIWAAGLDVFEEEPVPLNHPLLTLPNVTVLPHIGSASISTRYKMMNLNLQAITDVLEGREPKNQIV